MANLREWIIGRGADCDLVVTQSAVSSRHCRLVQTENGFLLEDLRSTNGTFVNNAPITGPTPVTPQDRIVLGLNVPMPWPQGLAPRVAPARVPAGPAASRAAPAPVKGGTGRPSILSLSGTQPIFFGRDANCSQVLDSPQISRRHAKLSRSGGTLLLEDLGSTNGTYLNRARIDKPTPVRVGDVIGLGVYSFKVTEQGRLEKSDCRGNLTVEARGISVDVPGRRLLDEVSLTIHPSEFVGLMGPSGAGKTTLMNALNGYTPPSAGQVLLNGQDLYAHYGQFSTHLGYVPQDDIIHRDLTVGQALYYTAKLRLPADFGRQEIEERIASVLRQLGLQGTENVLIGSPEKKGISGGQRKRVNLAMELLTDPIVLFLDEPTSGLSSEDALMVMKVLRGLADAGKTILLTIHQPSLEAFRLMDNLVLVSRDAGSRDPGRLVYYGPAYPDAVTFFNPGGIPHLARGADPSPDEVLRGLARRDTTHWVKEYRASPFCRKFVTMRSAPVAAAPLPEGRPRRFTGLSQFWTLFRRCLVIKSRDLWNTAILLAQAPIVALLVVMVFGDQVRQAEEVGNWTLASSGPVTLFLLALAALWFGCSNAVREIVGEWAIYHRERMVNLKISSYVFSKFAVLGTLCVFQCAVLLGMVHWGCQLKGPWVLMFGLLLLAALVGVGLGLAVSALARTSEVAIALLPLILIPMVILGGVMQPVHQMNPVVRWVSNLMASRWAFEGILLLESDARPRFASTPPIPGVEEAGPEEDMAQVYFPEGRQRRSVGVSLAILGIMLAGLFASIQMVLRARDVH